MPRSAAPQTPVLIDRRALPAAAALFPEASVLLLVDDVPVRRLLSRVLERAGYRVEDLAGGGGSWDLIIADLDRASEETVLWIESLAFRNPNAKVLALSSEPSAFGGAWTRLAKPFSAAALLEAAGRTLGARSLVGNSVRSGGRPRA